MSLLGVKGELSRSLGKCLAGGLVLDPIMSKPHIFSPGKEEKLMHLVYVVQLTHLKKTDVNWHVQGFSH